MIMPTNASTYLLTVLNDTTIKPSLNDDRKAATMFYISTSRGLGAPMKGGPTRSNGDDDDDDQRRGGS